jgi:hypothetical protein
VNKNKQDAVLTTAWKEVCQDQQEQWEEERSEQTLPASDQDRKKGGIWLM